MPGATFADAWRVDGVVGDVETVTTRAFSRAPDWVMPLMALRTLLVKPFGLKSGREPSAAPRIGLFPLISREPDRIVMGLDDRHLDFRLIVDLSGEGAATATTLVRTHNLGGRLYLATIMPFHRLIVPAMLARARGAAG